MTTRATVIRGGCPLDASNRSDTGVRDMMVGGSWVVRAGRHVGVEQALLARRAEVAHADRMAAHAQPFTAPAVNPATM